MTTQQQILEATGSGLSRIADSILSGPFKHDTVNHGTHHVKCTRCDEVIPLMERWDLKERFPCWVSPFDDLIPLTWPEAMKWRDWAVKEFGKDEFMAAFKKALNLKVHDYIFYFGFVTFDAQPEHYIKAACLCKLGNQP